MVAQAQAGTTGAPLTDMEMEMGTGVPESAEGHACLSPGIKGGAR